MAKFCPECGQIILDRSIPACPSCGARLPWASPGPAAPSPAWPEPAEPALPAEPAQSADPDRPPQPPVQPKPLKPFRPSPPAPAPGSARPQKAPAPAPHPVYIPPVDAVPRPARHAPGPAGKGGTGSNTALAWFGICCGGMIFLIVISAFFAMLSENPSSSSSSDSYQDFTAEPTYDSGMPETTIVPEEIAAMVGQTVHGNEAAAKVHSAGKTGVYTWTTGTSEYTFTEQAENGTVWLIIDAEVTNTGSSTLYASTSDFSLVDGKGVRYEPGLYYGDESFGYLKELSPGGKNRGKILFDIPPEAEDLKIFYDFGIRYQPAEVASWTIE